MTKVPCIVDLLWCDEADCISLRDTLVEQRLQAEGFILPPGYRMETGGESAERNSAVGKLLTYVGVIVTLLVVVVVLSFNSFRLSGIIFSVAIQSAGLGLLAAVVPVPIR